MKLHDHYRAEAVATASPAHLVTMLYDRAIEGLEVAAIGLRRRPKDLELSNRELQRTQRIVQELLVSLDRTRGGEIATNLADIYRYCMEQLVTANTTKAVEPIDEVHGHLVSLREAWVGAVDR